MSPTEKAERAKRILEDEVFIGMMEELRMSLVDSLEAVPMGDIDTQHEIALSLQLLKQMRSRLLSYGNDAAVEKHETKTQEFLRRMRQSYRLATPARQ